MKMTRTVCAKRWFQMLKAQYQNAIPEAEKECMFAFLGDLLGVSEAPAPAAKPEKAKPAAAKEAK